VLPRIGDSGVTTHPAPKCIGNVTLSSATASMGSMAVVASAGAAQPAPRKAFHFLVFFLELSLYPLTPFVLLILKSSHHVQIHTSFTQLSPPSLCSVLKVSSCLPSDPAASAAPWLDLVAVGASLVVEVSSVACGLFGLARFCHAMEARGPTEQARSRPAQDACGGMKLQDLFCSFTVKQVATRCRE
jgi:hypothetical protein